MILRIFWITHVVVLLGIALLFSGCGSGSGANQPTPDKITEPPKIEIGNDSNLNIAKSFEAKNLTRSEVETFCKNIEDSFTEGNGIFFKQSIDYNAMGERTFDSLEAKDDFKKDVIQTMEQSGDIGNQIAADILNKDTNIRLLRMVEKDGFFRPIFRLTGGEGLNYYELRLTKNKIGKILIGDIYVYTSGEDLSKTMRRTLLPTIMRHNKSLLDQLLSLGNKNEFDKYVIQIGEFARNIQFGNHQQAKKIYDTFPPSVQNSKYIMLLKLQFSNHLDDEAYMNDIATFKRLFPDDPATEMILIDYFSLKNNFKEALEAVNKLDKRVGGDPFLETYRSTFYLLDGKPKEAKQAAQNALDAKLNLPEPYYSLLQIYLEEKDHEKTKWCLEQLEDQFDVSYEEMETLEDFQHFVQSEAYQKWKAEHAPKLIP